MATGCVVTFGLGLGYYAYMVSEKSAVESVTIVEKDSVVISLFKTYILPQFPGKQKVTIIQADAFEYAIHQMPVRKYNYAFVDLWHDVLDGYPLYLEMKKMESLSPETTFLYWIEDSLLSYICVGVCFIKCRKPCQPIIKIFEFLKPIYILLMINLFKNLKILFYEGWLKKANKIFQRMPPRGRTFWMSC